MKNATTVRYYDKHHGWFHVTLLKRGYKWCRVQHLVKRADGTFKRRRVPASSVAEPLWEAK